MCEDARTGKTSHIKREEYVRKQEIPKIIIHEAKNVM